MKTPTSNPALPHPICLAKPADVVPHSYVLVTKSQFCQHCGRTQTWSDLYAKTHLRSRTGAGKYISNLRPVDHPEYNVPLTRYPWTVREIPFCVDCIETVSLAHLPSPPEEDAAVVLGVSLDPQTVDDRKERKKATKATNAPSAIDLMENL